MFIFAAEFRTKLKIDDMNHKLDVQGAIKRHGYTLAKVAELLGISSASISVMGRGLKAKNPNNPDEKDKPRTVMLDKLEAIANVIHCDLFEMWVTTDDEGNIVNPYGKKVVEKVVEKPITTDSEISGKEETKQVEPSQLDIDFDESNVPVAEVKDTIVVCPHCGKKIKVWQFIK